MTQHVLLNNVAHKDLRVITRPSAEFGHRVASVITFPSEYGDVGREYPIFFRKDPTTSEFISVALLGLAQDENLFLDEKGWNASYIPGVVARGPFLIGFQEQTIDGEKRREPVVHIDMDDPRVSTTEGEPLFLPQGGHTRYLERITAILKGIHDGVAMSKAMFAAFTSYGLIEPVKVEIKFNGEEQYDLVGLHTISEEKLRGLDGAALVNLNKSGLLQGAYLVLSSLSNVNRLIDMKHTKRAAQTPAAS